MCSQKPPHASCNVGQAPREENPGMGFDQSEVNFKSFHVPESFGKQIRVECLKIKARVHIFFFLEKNMKEGESNLSTTLCFIS